MKTNFKKIAILAGTTAAMAAGSMSAHAVITAVPAPAQLVPLFYYNTGIDTKVRITAPKSVGSDTVINLLGGTLPVATSWSTTSATSFTGTSPNAKMHYYVMSQTSKEVYDGTITVTPDDEYFLSAAALPFGTTTPMVSGTPYYLILTNENANLGGTPNFSFTAEAWISNTSGTYAIPDAVSIPVLGLADTADTTSYPTPTNNVIEAFTSAQGGPVASPIISGIRLSATAAGLIYRVVDVPFVGNNGSTSSDLSNSYNTLVAWNDRNGMTGRLYSLSSDEVLQSLGPFSLPNQLNIVKLGSYSGGTALGVLGITDAYTTQISNIGSTGTGTAGTPPSGTLAGNGFLKLVIDANALPAASSSLAIGAYSSTFMFTIPTAVNTGGVESGTLDVLDTGFFTSN